jgi:hypothetical protein
MDCSVMACVISKKITKIDDKTIGLSLNPKHEIKEQRQEHKN